MFSSGFILLQIYHTYTYSFFFTSFDSNNSNKVLIKSLMRETIGPADRALMNGFVSSPSFCTGMPYSRNRNSQNRILRGPVEIRLSNSCPGSQDRTKVFHFFPPFIDSEYFTSNTPLNERQTYNHFVAGTDIKIEQFFKHFN